MRKRGRVGPLDPIFDPGARRGAIEVGNTPGTSPFTTALTPLLEYDGREWDGVSGDMPNLTAIGADWDLPKVPGTRWQLSPPPATYSFVDVCGDLATFVPTFVMAWGEFPSGSDDAIFDMEVEESSGSDYWFARLRFANFFNGTPGRLSSSIRYRAYYFDGAVDVIDIDRTYSWLETSGVPEPGCLIVNIDPVSGGLSAKINDVDMTVASAISAPVAGDATDWATTAGTRLFNAGNIEYDTELAAGSLPLEIAGMALTRGVPASGDFNYWASRWGVTLP